MKIGKTSAFVVISLVVVVIGLVVGGRNYLKNKAVKASMVLTQDQRDSLDAMQRDLDVLNRQLESMGKDVDMATLLELFKGYKPKTKPTNGVNLSFHDGGYESSWIQDIDRKEGLVLVTTIDSKMSIVFKPAADKFQGFNVGWIAPVTFQCSKLKKGKCDFKSPYKLFVSNGLVEVKELKFPKK